MAFMHGRRWVCFRSNDILRLVIIVLAVSIVSNHLFSNHKVFIKERERESVWWYAILFVGEEFPIVGLGPFFISRIMLP